MIRIDASTCNGCQTCEAVCPHAVIQIVRDRACLAHEERCIECAACQLNCPEGAIDVTKGVGCLFAIIKEDILKMGGDRTPC